jgi:outer membrane protein TolC
VAGLLAMPIFNAGRTRALNEVAESGQREALLRAEDGMVRRWRTWRTRWSRSRRTAALAVAADRRASAEAALGRAQSLYDRGQIDLLPLLDAQRSRWRCA